MRFESPYVEIIIGIVGFALLYRVYDVFFGSIAKSVRNTPGVPKRKLNALQSYGESFVAPTESIFRIERGAVNAWCSGTSLGIKDSCAFLIQKYGLPEGKTNTVLVWEHCSPWNRIVLRLLDREDFLVEQFRPRPSTWTSLH